MKFIKVLLTLIGSLIIYTYPLHAKNYEWKSKNDAKPLAEKSMACAPATELVLLQYNNVRALIETGGSMWQDRATNRAFYRVPAEGDQSVIFAGSLWLGGLDGPGNLKMAALTFRQDGNDFWPGPLTVNGAAEVDQETCQDYDRFFLTERVWSEQHRAYYDCLYDPQCDVDESFPDGYIIPTEFYDYPAHGNQQLGQSFYLAPFYDYPDPNTGEGNGIYDPEEGDHPWYDINKDIDCSSKRREDPVPLFGDQNYWWVFNDKGNIHSESGGVPIGMEIQAQAFSFATNDEINNMTFYNYVLINRGSLELRDTYFGQWVDPDVGYNLDDYVGCDVQRGLGFAYNGDNIDDGIFGYGENPPAVGIDFFEGPYQDYDLIDNAGPEDNLNPISYEEAMATNGIPYKGLGIGYGDGVPDNERFGMRKFLYYNNDPNNPVNGDPIFDFHYYNYLTGKWKDSNMNVTYDGADGTDQNFPPTDFMFPGNSDVVGFGTNGEVMDEWNESVLPFDRRFIQSAGPFTLMPGDYNNITVGVIYGRAPGGGPLASVEVMKQADDKAQALFDNCFKIVSGPTAPDVTCQELDQEIILYLSNNAGATTNNENESFNELDPTILDENSLGDLLTDEQKKYKFQGYVIYQLADASVSPAELRDLDKARVVKTMDIVDGITTVYNWDLDPEIPLEVEPINPIFGEDSGIQHSISIKEDLFASSSTQLINYKTYHFMVIAYAHNNYEDYNPDLRTGQDMTYLTSRNSSTGAIRVYSCIPHPVQTEENGTLTQLTYGDGIPLTRLEGTGNGNSVIDISLDQELKIMEGAPWKLEETSYKPGASPVLLKVIDPLALKDIDFELRLHPEDPELINGQTPWELTDLTNGIVIPSDMSIQLQNEQLLLDYGISIEWTQYQNQMANQVDPFSEPLEATISFDDPQKPWLLPYPDVDGFSDYNWIRSGTSDAGEDAMPNESVFNDYGISSSNLDNADPEELFEGLISGLAAPYVLTSFSTDGEQGGTLIQAAPTAEAYHGNSLSIQNFNKMDNLNNVDIVFTDKKEHWTRCPVLEMQHNTNLIQTHPLLSSYQSSGEKMKTRKHPSIDKNGLYAGQDGYNETFGDFNGEQPEGMSWFPGYAIDQDTGERLNMAFGEDSWLGSENGRDMIWNPTNNPGPNGTYAGGQHWVYVFRNVRNDENENDVMPRYDEGSFLYESLVESNGAFDVYRSCTWVLSALLSTGQELKSMANGLIPSEARVRLRVTKEYQKFSAQGADITNPNEYSESANNWNPLYTFSTRNFSTEQNRLDILEDALANINVVPNPYYAFSSYENNKLDNRIKITNLPFKCEISIYNLSGGLIRHYKKANPATYLDWDLKNSTNIPIASGIYLIHIKTDAGERVLKWFGVMRPTDIEQF